MSQTTATDLYADILDLRDLHERHLSLIEQADEDDLTSFEQDEYEYLYRLATELHSQYGYDTLLDAADPVLIAKSYFTTYAQELADDLGVIDPDASWPLSHIDWEAAAAELAQDYTMIDFAGREFYWRAG